MASVKIVLRKKKNKDGTYPLTHPLAIRITKDRKSSFVYIGQYVKESEWDSVQLKVKKSHKNSGRLNNFIAQKLAEANDKLLNLETQRRDVSSVTVRSHIKRKGSSSTFIAQADIFIASLKAAGKYNRLSAEEPRVNRFKEFLKGEDIAFQDITVSLLNRFQVHLKSTRKISERTIVNHLVVIRSIFSQAIKDNVADRKHYPFGHGNIRIKFPDSTKIGLNREEVKALEELNLKFGSHLHHARNVWLFSFYFAGMRVSDVLRLRWSDFKDDRLHYTMGKNTKGGSLKVPAKALGILDKYKKQKRSKDDLIFPELKMIKDMDNNMYEVQKRIKNGVGRLNNSLKDVAKLAEIDKKITMHIARHTFGHISGEHIPIQMLQKLYRHSSITTTIGYQGNFIHKDADDALDAVIDF